MLQICDSLRTEQEQTNSVRSYLCVLERVFSNRSNLCFWRMFAIFQHFYELILSFPLFPLFLLDWFISKRKNFALFPSLDWIFAQKFRLTWKACLSFVPSCVFSSNSSSRSSSSAFWRISASLFKLKNRWRQFQTLKSYCAFPIETKWIDLLHYFCISRKIAEFPANLANLEKWFSNSYS